MVDEIDETGKRFIQMGLSGNPQATRWFERKGFDLFALKVSFLFFWLPLILLRSNRS
jgi:hypothetical protein